MAKNFQPEKLTLLTDEQMRFYIQNGYLFLSSSFDESFHIRAKNAMDGLLSDKGTVKVGNNITNRLPILTSLWNSDPVVQGALVSLLGENFDCHAHRHLHLSPPGKREQVMHMDSHWGFNLSRPSRHRRLMLMYYPHQVKDEMGPTSICPGTQYFHSATPDFRHIAEVPDCWKDATEKRLTVGGGTICIIDYNLWHRGTANVSKKNRWMLKMLFVRNEEPSRPTWDHQSIDWPGFEKLDPIRRYMWLDTWHWFLGENRELPASDMHVNQLQSMLLDKNTTLEAETNRLMAAAHLGAMNQAAILLSALSHGATACRSAQHGLSLVAARGKIHLLLEKLTLLHQRAMGNNVRIIQHRKQRSRFHNLYPYDTESCQRSALVLALGEAPLSKTVFDCLVTMVLKDPCPCVQRDAIESLTHFARKESSERTQTLAAKAMCVTLFDSEGVLRMLAARALRAFQIRGFALTAQVWEHIKKKSESEKENRYVMETLHRMLNAGKTKDELDRYWCPLTTRKSEF